MKFPQLGNLEENTVFVLVTYLHLHKYKVRQMQVRHNNYIIWADISDNTKLQQVFQLLLNWTLPVLYFLSLYQDDPALGRPKKVNVANRYHSILDLLMDAITQ
jgi:hypothetical protein